MFFVDDACSDESDTSDGTYVEEDDDEFYYQRNFLWI